jgi:hypothetical protein
MKKERRSQRKVKNIPWRDASNGYNSKTNNITILLVFAESLWSWLYGSWIYNYMCNQCLSPLKLWVQTPFRGVLDTTLCDDTTDWWFSLGNPVCSTNKSVRHDITEIFLKMVLSTINQTMLVFARKSWRYQKGKQKMLTDTIHSSPLGQFMRKP